MLFSENKYDDDDVYIYFSISLSLLYIFVVLFLPDCYFLSTVTTVQETGWEDLFCVESVSVMAERHINRPAPTRRQVRLVFR